jgi:hypothetical protein
MATVATYVFNNDENWNAAKNALLNQLGGSSYDSGYSGSNDYIYITSECNDPALAAKICSGYGGKPY